MKELMRDTRIYILGMMVILLSSCSIDEYSGMCGIVAGGDSELLNNWGDYTYYLDIQFGNKIDRVTVDEKTYVSYYVGDGICFR
jgi:hypothetical protein